MNKLSTEERIAVVSALVEGNSIRATVRMTGVAKNTVVKLLRDLGKACRQYHDEHVRNLNCVRVQADEIWCFCYCKEANVPEKFQGKIGYGDAWTWTAIDADNKLCVTWRVATRDIDDARAFVSDIASRLSNRIQLTTDGYTAYINAVGKAFGPNIDFAMLVKQYKGQFSNNSNSARYSPSVCTGCKRTPITGSPDPDHISTSFVERSNLTMRMSMRRFTRLTNGFSKKMENLAYAVDLHFTHYNFCRVHQTLKTTPAIAAGLTDRKWSISDLVALLDRQTISN